jgi:murein L,D-transpeptidase YcbB/YkuD
MERWRWVPEQLGENYILDNIPEFLTRIVENGQVVDTARIVVGKPSTPTPIFSNSIKYVEFHIQNSLHKAPCVESHKPIWLLS